MYQLAYTSTASKLMAPRDLAEILDASRDNNKTRGLTGMLLYQAGTFLQVLEGEEETVLEVYGVIQEDGRHTGVITLHEGEVGEREFPDFTMGFRHLGDLRPGELEGFSPFMQGGFTPERFQDDPSHAQNVLMRFRDMEVDHPTPDAGNVPQQPFSSGGGNAQQDGGNA